MRGCVFLPGHVVYIKCLCCPDVCDAGRLSWHVPLWPACFVFFRPTPHMHLDPAWFCRMWVIARLPAMCWLCSPDNSMCDAGRLCWHVPLWPACFVFFRPTTHMHLDPSFFCSWWAISLLPSIWCLLCALVAQMCDAGWPAMLACAPLTSLLCFLSTNTTHASGSLLILQPVSDRLAACHVVLVVCPRCADVCSCPDMWCILYALVAQMCDAGRLCWHVPLWLACFVFFRPTPHMHLDPSYFCSWWVIGLLPAMWCWLCPLVAQACDAGSLCWHVPLLLACIVFFRPTPHMHLDPSWICSWWAISLLPAMWCWLCTLNAQMCADGWPGILACAPLTSLLCFLLPNTAHASGSLLILQLVSDRLAACHVVLVVCPRCADVCSCPAMWCILCALVAQMCDAGRVCWHVPLWLACIGFFRPTPHMPLDPSYFCSWWVIGLLPGMWCLLCALDARMCVPARPCGVYSVPLLPRCVMLAGYAGMCPSDQPALFSFAQHHTCIWIPLDSAGCEWLPDCPPCAGYVPPIIPCVMLAGYAGMCPSDLPALFSFAQPHTCLWIPLISAAGEWSACCLACGACCVPSMRGCVFLPGHVVYIMCPCCPDVWCWQAMLACAPLTCLLCFLSPNTTHASGSLLILRPVSEWLAACHVVLVVCPRCADVCSCPAMWCILCALVAQMCDAGRLCWHVPLWPACFVFFRPTPHMRLDPAWFRRLWVIARLPAMWCLLCALDNSMCGAGMLCWHVPLWLACFVFFRPTPHMHLDPSWFCSPWVIGLLPAMWCLLCALDARMCVPARPCGVYYVPLLPRCVMLAGYAGMCPSDWPALCSFVLPHTCIWIPPISAAGEWSACCLPCGACCVPSMRGCVFLPGHVVYILCPCCPDVWCWQATLACAPLTSLLCFLSPNTTHASGSLLILQPVSEWLAACHVVLVVCPRCADVCSCPAMWCIFCALVAQMCDAGRLCWYVPLWPACIGFFRPTPHMHLDPSYFCSGWVIGLLPAMWCLLCALDAQMCVPARPCGVYSVPLLLRCVMLAGYAGMCPSDQPALFSFAIPHTCIWIPPDSAAREWMACSLRSGAYCVPSMRGCVFLPGHVVYIMCPCCPDVWCWQGMLACAPLTGLLCFLSLNTTHASGSLLFLQLVSDWLAAPCGAGYVPSLLKCALLAGHAGCAPPTCIPRLLSLSTHMQFCKDKTLMKSAFVCPVGWGGSLCGTPTKLGPARTAPLHPRYNTSDCSTFCCSQEPFNCLLASRSWPTACHAVFSTQPSIKRSANAQIRLPQPTPIESI